MVSLVNPHTHAASKWWHLREIDLRFASACQTDKFQRQRQPGRQVGGESTRAWDRVTGAWSLELQPRTGQRLSGREVRGGGK